MLTCLKGRLGRVRAVWVVHATLVSLIALGCGGKTEVVPGGGGIGGGLSAVPASGAGSGSASDNAPVSPEGAATLSIFAPAFPSSGMACPETKTYAIGKPAPTTTDIGTPLDNGNTDHAAIGCSLGENHGYNFVASLSGDAPNGTISMIVDATIGNGSGQAKVSVFTTDLIRTITAETPCTITVLNQHIEPSVIWAKFDCASLTAAAIECSASGVFVFEHCTGA
jgi:hypothetical protein